MVSVLPDYTIFIQMVTFLALVFILNILLYKPILSIIDRRKKRFEEIENEIKLFNDSVNTKQAEYEEKLKQAKASASELKKEIIQEGNTQAKEVIDAVRAEIPLMTQEFQKKIEKEISSARQVLDKQTNKLSLDIAQKVLGRSVR